MQFAALDLVPETLTGLGLPDMAYEVPAVYSEHVGVNPEAPPLAVMLFSLQKRAAQGNAD